MHITYLGHSAVHITTEHGGKAFSLLIDPFLQDNPRASHKPEALEADYILLTHAHSDHYGDTESIAKRCDATVISNFEIANYAERQGLKAHPMSIGGCYRFPFGNVCWTPAFHSSSFEDGSYGGMPMGLVLELEGKRIYHAGDTGIFSDMQRIGDKGIDLAFVPIGDNFTMGIEDALESVTTLLRPKQVVPIHYNTFPYIEVDVQRFAEPLGECCKVLEPGESLTL